MGNNSKRNIKKIIYITTAILLANNEIIAAEEETGLDIINALEESQQNAEQTNSENNAGVTTLPELSDTKNQATNNENGVSQIPSDISNASKENAQNAQQNIQQAQPVANSQEAQNQPTSQTIHFINGDGTVFTAPSELKLPPEMQNSWFFITNDIASVEKNLVNAQKGSEIPSTNQGQVPQQQLPGEPAPGWNQNPQGQVPQQQLPGEPAPGWNQNPQGQVPQQQQPGESDKKSIVFKCIELNGNEQDPQSKILRCSVL